MPWGERMDRACVVAAVLAGGRGSRMDGLDKGLQPFRGSPLALHAARRLQQQGLANEHIAIVANRNLDLYQALGYRVLQDVTPAFHGPLAGIQAALHGVQSSATAAQWVLTVPCDTPGFPADLVARMMAAVSPGGHKLAFAQGPDGAQQAPADGPTPLRAQPAFCLVHTDLRADLDACLARGERQVMRWIARHRGIAVNFNQSHDCPSAFNNLNTTAALKAAQGSD